MRKWDITIKDAGYKGVGQPGTAFFGAIKEANVADLVQCELDDSVVEITIRPARRKNEVS